MTALLLDDISDALSAAATAAAAAAARGVTRNLLRRYKPGGFGDGSPQRGPGAEYGNPIENTNRAVTKK